MTPETSGSTTTTSATPLHCQHRSSSGRRFCRMAISHPDSGLCSRHAAEHQKDLDQVDLAAALIGSIEEFRSAADINHSLGELYKLQARNKITPRRRHGLRRQSASPHLPCHRARSGNSQEPDLDFSDWDKPHPLVLASTPPPQTDPSQPRGPAVWVRRMEALRKLSGANATLSQSSGNTVSSEGKTK
jgi:hypothetical protein